MTASPITRSMRTVALAAISAAASLLAHAEPSDCDNAPQSDTATKVVNRDGSSLELKPSGCEMQIVLNAHGRTSTPLSLDVSDASVAFVDLNEDGTYEVEHREACGGVNCNVTIYAI